MAPELRLSKSSWTRVCVLSCLVLVITLMLFGCWGASSTPTVTVLGEDFSNLHALESLKGDYQNKYNVKLEFIGNTFDVFNQKANQDLANGTGLYDVILHYSSVLHNYAGNNWVLTVNETKQIVTDPSLYSFESEIFPNVWKESSYYPTGTDKTSAPIGYPFAANTMVLVYNRKLFDDPQNQAAYKSKFGQDLSAPTDWKGFRQVAEFFTAPDKSTYGVVLQGASGSPLYWEWCNFAFGMGGGVMKKNYGWEGDASTPIIIDSPETVEATRFYVSLKPYNAGDFFSTGQAEQQEMMRTQKIAMAIMWSDSLFALINGPQGGDFGFAPIPGQKSLIGGGTFYINKKSKYQKEAAEYVLRMMQKDNQVKLMTKGLCSALKSAYDDPEVKKIPYIDAVRKSLDRGVYMLEAGPDSGVILETIEKTVQNIWRGEVTPEEGLKAAKQEIEAKRAEIFKTSR